jgi:hypothetical protein
MGNGEGGELFLEGSAVFNCLDGANLAVVREVDSMLDCK